MDPLPSLKFGITVLIGLTIITVFYAFAYLSEERIANYAVSTSWFGHEKISRDYYIDFEQLSRENPRLNETGLNETIVPNIVHMIRFDDAKISFINYLSIKSILKYQKPDVIHIHTNLRYFSGKYWRYLKNETKIRVTWMEKPRHIFHQTLDNVFHSADVARIRILMQYGGIYLDSDILVLKSLQPFRKYEMTLGWPLNKYIGNQVLIAHKDARFLKLYLDSYKDYRPEQWYYNGGELPTTSILYKRPDLVHRVAFEFGVHMMVPDLYINNLPEDQWQGIFFTVHLLSGHLYYLIPNDPAINFDEDIVKSYNKTFGAMARLVLFDSTKLLE